MCLCLFLSLWHVLRVWLVTQKCLISYIFECVCPCKETIASAVATVILICYPLRSCKWNVIKFSFSVLCHSIFCSQVSSPCYITAVAVWWWKTREYRHAFLSSPVFLSWQTSHDASFWAFIHGSDTSWTKHSQGQRIHTQRKTERHHPPPSSSSCLFFLPF